MTYLILIFVFLFGLIIGSFLNCLIWRVYKGEGMWNRSYCPKCKKQIAWYDNIPVLSFCLLGGKCRHCQKAISWQYPIIELIMGILFLIAFYTNFQVASIINLQIPPAPFIKGGVSQFLIFNFKFLIELFRDWFLIAVMIVVFVIDLRWYLILDIVVLPAAAIVFILNLILGISWQNLLISGIIGGSFFLIQFLISKGKWIGGGDIRLGLLMGLALGWPNILVALFLAYFIGSIVGIGLILAGKKKWGGEVPLGTFLSVTTVIALFWGSRILDWYINQLTIIN
jgi:prepilin signal peptidase PulO-like enzyme (type II secretory pathway)